MVPDSQGAPRCLRTQGEAAHGGAAFCHTQRLTHCYRLHVGLPSASQPTNPYPQSASENGVFGAFGTRLGGGIRLQIFRDQRVLRSMQGAVP